MHLNRVIACDIGASSWSDHNPVTLTIADHYNYKNRGPCQLNEQLLNDPHFVHTLQQDLHTYFQSNNTTDISPLTLWMAHILVIRGILIRRASHLKKQQHQAHIQDLHRANQITPSKTMQTAKAEKSMPQTFKKQVTH
ncbi:Hypothetical predicted protein [Pelobates cultripes]|uniref:Uncharacterized protein n=1 Tax=Pelobates cultripes TaxID=61616 RepID=A0AAD1VZA4_PELCU|nr:Hypothetical predicted protein [Pelobates cultripes]